MVRPEGSITQRAQAVREGFACLLQAQNLDVCGNLTSFEVHARAEPLEEGEGEGSAVQDDHWGKVCLYRRARAKRLDFVRLEAVL